uniref:F-ATPase gamma subunit n=1 Tax=Polytomella sp. Pringsheim 198.80 TaxID=37502 RepID=Q4LDE7_9CHLO|nr:Chain S, ATP synthase gamma chain, mitochondrial [Polytomella sp. Pringsheim 198.80]6RD9_S Chain S, ATP synthase gamma chain, mitochondrial [Polytomella sp. Pringsheim 198.80]6RDB_S Chain S, ATP synthase gamma chain, mitochondrial [Polytomella sp. Pringsheim 198.80]6RDC_S Chain S, ATP synthase gamma chain, mitochondrial [Polytomella sp. Pringsheim 198.80]6RDE_S Chain S, ATP synthase gamma chain, mitochondrial [Polytomella sp. Pringsheim 198.80]6RDG_S Chain S, ATP synthase gamma chain, mitoc
MALRKAVLSLGLSQGVAAEAVLGSGMFNAVQHESVRYASNQAVKQRIRAIKNIGKITKAMKMVAASKMKNAQIAVEQSRGLVDPFVRLFGDFPAVNSNKSVVVAVTSDKGLCGGLNSNITKYTRATLATTESEGKDVVVVSIGDKGRSQLTRIESQRYQLAIADTYKVRVTFGQASLIVEELIKHNPQSYQILFNKFRSAISFKPTVATILSPDLLEKQLEDVTGNSLDAYDIEASHERSDVLRDLTEFHLGVTLYNAMLENNCSEHASRMSAMENSTKSAGEMLGKLTLDYNRKRQATITTELIEIIAGASALMDE